MIKIGKINLDKYSIVRVYKCVKIKCEGYGERGYYFTTDRFSIVKRNNYCIIKKYVKDVITKEKYYLNAKSNIDYNTLCVFGRQVPFNELNLNNVKYMNKADFLKLCKSFLIELNNENITDEKINQIKIKTKEYEDLILKEE